ENPHETGWFYETDDAKDDPLALSKFEFLQGKELSYNNYLDMDGALFALTHLGADKAACVIVKHTNPCGAARRPTAKEAYQAAWYEGDPLAAFGGVMGVTREVDEALAEAMIENFFEILMAPSVTAPAKAAFAKKPNLRVMVNPALAKPLPWTGFMAHRVRGGMLVQDADSKEMKRTMLKTATKRAPTDREMADLLFAWAVCRATKSNTVVAAKGETLVASGAGQQDRKRCAELCALKGGERLKGAVAASDGFFPFPDGLEVLIKAGVTAVIQPGGSIKDSEVVSAADKAGIAMVMTGTRAFRH
ncbi:MAG: bifunctional phosphoribosylaminoimidazolecarboxamide formyltransferase/IMP cyclohydrolase, partial [Patescibacteria group bacterium]